MKPTTFLRRALLCTFALAPMLAQPLAALPPDSTEAMGQKFADPKPAKAIRVLLVGSGTSHDFPKFFLGTDAETLKAADAMDIAATPNLEEALALLPQADVLVFSGNHDQFGEPEFQKALHGFADNRKGIVFLHAATWHHPKWKGYNDRFINGNTPGHSPYGDITVAVKDAQNPLMKDIPATFTFKDENYQTKLVTRSKAEIVAENSPDNRQIVNPSVWIVKDSKARIVCITLGHDASAHDHAAYKQLLLNAVNWAAAR